MCLVKNLINCLRTSTGCVGELCNFLLGAIFAFVAGTVYQSFQKKKTAKPVSGGSSNRFTQFAQNSYDFAALEKEILSN